MTDNLATYIASDIPGGKPALIFDQGHDEADVTSFADFRQHCASAADALRRAGAVKGSRVAIIAGNHRRYFAAFYAILQVGAVACPINDKLPSADKLKALRLISADYTFVDRHHRRLQSLHRFSLDDDGLFTGSAETDICPVGGHDLACIMITAGSPGAPKAVPITHAGYGWALRQFDAVRDASRSMRTLVAAPFFHMNAQSATMLALYSGGTTIHMAGFVATDFLDAIGRYKIQKITGVPDMLDIAIRALNTGHSADIGSVNIVAVGSAPMSDGLAQRIAETFPGATFYNHYSCTEGGMVVFRPGRDGQRHQPISVGYAAQDVDIVLEGDSGDEGTMWIKTPMTTAGYIGDAAQTAAKFKDGYYCTGDIMHRDADGIYSYVGRKDDVFMCGKDTIFPGEIARVMRLHAAISDAVIVPKNDAMMGQVPFAFATLNIDMQVSQKALKDHILHHLPDCAVPKRIVFLTDFPLGSTAKIDRHYLTYLANLEQ